MFPFILCPCPAHRLRWPVGKPRPSNRGSAHLSLSKYPLPCSLNQTVNSRPGPVFLSEAGPWVRVLAHECLLLCSLGSWAIGYLSSQGKGRGRCAAVQDGRLGARPGLDGRESEGQEMMLWSWLCRLGRAAPAGGARHHGQSASGRTDRSEQGLAAGSAGVGAQHLCPHPAEQV